MEYMDGAVDKESEETLPVESKVVAQEIKVESGTFQILFR
jgi:hypothetical protein